MNTQALHTATSRTAHTVGALQPLNPAREQRALVVFLSVALIALIARWLFGPIAQPASFHNFANAHSHFGLPNACDVLSNLPFAAAGIAGLIGLQHAKLQRHTQACATVFFVGLLFTAAGSAIYHWAPSNPGLAIDRLGMAIAFAGLLGWIAAEQLSQRAGWLVLIASSAFAPFAVLWWATTQDLSAWVFLQAGGLVAIAAMATATGPMRKVAWQVIAWYALAKVFETLDHQIYEITAELVSGHSLKHLAAALAAAAPIVWARGKQFGNGAEVC